MWFDNVVEKIPTDTEYSRQQVYEMLLEARPDLSTNSFKWIVHTIVEKGRMLTYSPD